ncbi:MAG: F420-dependent methylenetetrahydromethanopterin dehydrogenase, partial [Candidatus Bathyarchaeia archaeon]
MRKVKIGFAKVGNIGCSPLMEFLLDERAEREDIEVRVFGSGSKMDPETCLAVATETIQYRPDLLVFTCPNAALPGPGRARDLFRQSGLPTVIVSDNPAKKAIKAMEEAGIGYLIVEGDVMIGARREFLD